MREAIRARHYSRRTEKAYVAWARRYILFHGKRHPLEMSAVEVGQFLTSLAVDRRVAASTQKPGAQRPAVPVREVLDQQLPWLEEVVRARRPAHLPVVLTRVEGASSPRPSGRRPAADGPLALRRRLAGPGVRQAASEGCRLRGEPFDGDKSDITSSRIEGDHRWARSP
jgi:hypothetical protein